MASSPRRRRRRSQDPVSARVDVSAVPAAARRAAEDSGAGGRGARGAAPPRSAGRWGRRARAACAGVVDPDVGDAAARVIAEEPAGQVEQIAVHGLARVRRRERHVGDPRPRVRRAVVDVRAHRGDGVGGVEAPERVQLRAEREPLRLEATGMLVVARRQVCVVMPRERMRVCDGRDRYRERRRQHPCGQQCTTRALHPPHHYKDA